ncbi:MAG: hydroxyphenylacetyl-CoA thioesterase PaaI [Actinomyces sp.]|nr:MAG: hydroxyphenylacetyl-CoA thioesterase PaaI [Actinomyces sp.]
MSHDAVAHTHRLHDGDPHAAWLGITLVTAGEGRAEVTLTVADHMLNVHGTCHGGVLFSLADAAFQYACNSHGPVAVAAAADIDFLAPVGPGTRLRAVATERARRGRSGIYDVAVLAPDGSVVAEFRGRSRVLDRPPGPADGDRR